MFGLWSETATGLPADLHIEHTDDVTSYQILLLLLFFLFHTLRRIHLTKSWSADVHEGTVRLWPCQRWPHPMQRSRLKVSNGWHHPDHQQAGSKLVAGQSGEQWCGLCWTAALTRAPRMVHRSFMCFISVDSSCRILLCISHKPQFHLNVCHSL